MPDTRTVAVLGASADRSKFSNKSVRAHAAMGWDVYPVNPKGGEIEGLPAYASLGEITVKLDRITVYLPPPIGLKALPEIAAAGAREVYFNPGAESPELVAEAERLGIKPILACSIVELGVSPAMFPG